ncbi:hypothetical protein H5202_05145 [Shewanella sp. SG41-4]|uniref:hypothetical protein n=1 Tax=Shewanella sp. SG41-4 TaxID=2760976 RepID=UPI001603A904|nr:hypothetical protein [Shewanella sp. SG41-4]MBB1438077.1 hypothetical protein [Shewanella sp. SG41-4]
MDLPQIVNPPNTLGDNLYYEDIVFGRFTRQRYALDDRKKYVSFMPPSNMTHTISASTLSDPAWEKMTLTSTWKKACYALRLQRHHRQRKQHGVCHIIHFIMANILALASFKKMSSIFGLTRHLKTTFFLSTFRTRKPLKK